jgi:thiol-disulfide isomerase/thioredoxin
MGRVSFRFRLARVFPATIALLLGAASVWSQNSPTTGIDLEGRPADPLKMSAGKATVLVFVRTDCPVANRYAPTIQELSAAYGGKAVFWLVYPSRAETAEQIRQHEQEYGYKMQALRDPQHVLVKAAEVQITPEVAVFDRSRKLVYHGRIDDLYVDIAKTRSAPTTHDLADALQAAISGKALAVQSKPGVGCFISDLE